MFTSRNGSRASLRFAVQTVLIVGATAGAPLATAADAPPAALKPIVVTATRVGGTVMETPAAVSVLSSNVLGPAAINDISDIQYDIPNVSIGYQFGVNRTFIRGIGLGNIELGADGSVAYYLDGAPIALPAAQLGTFFDIARIEVLRGPQGTLYGRNATAGSIVLTSRRPDRELTANADLTYGNYGLVVAEGGVGGPISDTLRFRLAGKAESHDGYGVNRFTGRDVNDRNYHGFRASLEWQPTENLDATLIADYTREKDHNYALNYFGPTTIDPLYGQQFGGQTIFDWYAERGKKVNLQDVMSNSDMGNDRMGHGYTGLVVWEGEGIKIQSTTAYRTFYRQNQTDLDATDFDAWSQVVYSEDSRTFSQEFVANIDRDRWSLLLGANYFNEHLFGSTFAPMTNLDLLYPGVPPDGVFDEQGTIDVHAYALFGQGTYKLTDHLDLTAGVRFSHEKRVHHGTYTFSPFGFVDVPTDKSGDWSAWTPKFNLKYTFDNGAIVYGNIERGFKSGVISIGTPNPVVNPEYVWSYEVGAKTDLLDDRVSVSGAAFYYNYTDLQVGRVEELSPVTENAAAAKNKGVELEVLAHVTDALSLQLTGTYLDAKFTKFTTKEPNRPELGVQNLAGHFLPNAPKFTYGIGAHYRVPVSSFGDLTFGAKYNWTDKIYFTEFNNSDAVQKAYSMLDASIGFTSSNDVWHVDLWGKNLTDETVKANNIVASFLFGFPQVGSLYPPRTYGLTAGFKF